ncbi:MULTISPECIES: hypothetical protein [Gordonia]|uniref:hypothetical protein n=1 Tax=Gordonia TaxID=2053 RepID=UPI001331917D|nr:MULTISPECIES: hypothetical protein [Gordonia]KAF0969646.1 hypothetical protein BPODLACK_01930 [Gordonia sp. YY1]MCZ0912124.1 hypothetical protein [Gordonia amicalis]UPW13670.1 hypothetical protein M0655_20990 [Gordonia amicalis]
MGPAYQRTTVRADLSALPADLAAALRDHAESRQLTITDDLPAWITRSINPPSSSLTGKLFGRRANPADPDSEHQTLVALHPTHLLVVVSGANRGISALSVPLAVASVETPESADGFAVTGFAGQDGRPGSYHLGVGEPHGAECLEAVRAAIVAAKNP